MGLVISENIVRSFGGSIGVKSKYQIGTQFSFSILLGIEEKKDNIFGQIKTPQIEQP